MNKSHTIVALSTPPGRSGIGVIRISGAMSLDFTRSILRNNEFSPQPRQAILQKIYDPENGGMLDHALVTYFKAPNSFTGEDVIEISCHGSPTLLLHVIDALLHLGACPANAGEFTLRALANGRLNLSQAEAIRDLIDAQTYAGVRQAARQLGGELSGHLQHTKDSLLSIIVPLESSLEFVEDDLPRDIYEKVASQLDSLASQTEELASTFRNGNLVKNGIRVTLAGRPNVGKSSLFNALIMSERAIVTGIPGTTRDSLSEAINIDGIPVVITDTAGLRSSNDEIELLGIERSYRAIFDADLVVIVVDCSQGITAEDEDVIHRASESTLLIAHNKVDLSACERIQPSHDFNGLSAVYVSAKTGFGLKLLKSSMVSLFTSIDMNETSFLITNARHYDLLKRAAVAITCAKDQLREGKSEELILVGLYDALHYFGELTGETTTEDVLSQIFSSFCIGK